MLVCACFLSKIDDSVTGSESDNQSCASTWVAVFQNSGIPRFIPEPSISVQRACDFTGLPD